MSHEYHWLSVQSCAPYTPEEPQTFRYLQRELTFSLQRATELLSVLALHIGGVMLCCWLPEPLLGLGRPEQRMDTHCDSRSASPTAARGGWLVSVGLYRWAHRLSASRRKLQLLVSTHSDEQFLNTPTQTPKESFFFFEPGPYE